MTLYNNHRTCCLLLIAACLCLLFSQPASALVKLPAIFSDHMVLQQKASAPLWGWADPGEKVIVRTGWSKTLFTTQADPSGKWKVILPTPAAGGPFTIDVEGGNHIHLQDVLIGEVWLCSGQSNMVFSLKSSEHAQQEIAQANFPAIRYFSVTRQYANRKFDDSPGAAWQTTTPATAPSFSAVAYYFAKKLQKNLNVPIGLVYSAWGGTPAEAWTPESVLKADTVLSRYIDRWRFIQENVGKDSANYHIALANATGAAKKPEEPQTLYYYDRPWREPGVLFSGMIDPVIPFAIKGVLWYQGESNVNYAGEYFRLLSAMIHSWRARWGTDTHPLDFPFYVVQISAFGYSSLDNAARVREAEYQVMKEIPNTGMAVTADLGNMKNIHYTRKEEVGDRLARIALARDYGEKKLPYKGPEAQSATEENGQVMITFEPTQPAVPLSSGSSAVKGFELGYQAPSGDSLLFVPADAKIEGDKVMVWNDQVKNPVEVRYAWLLVGEANLFNTVGLPAFPFRMKVRPASAQETNLALHKPVIANSENSRYPAFNVTDGRITRESKWMSGKVQPPHILEVNLQQYCNISRVVIHTGIPEAERTPAESAQAAGFWSAKNFKLQYWDDANWTDIPNTEIHENRLTDVPYTFSPAINSFKLRFVCDDGEPISIMEIEVFGTATGNRAPAGGASPDLVKKSERTEDQNLTIRISDSVIGKTMQYVGYNQGYYVPGSNASGWLEYAGVNSLRIWTTLNSYVPAAAVQVDETIKDVAAFDRRKQQLRDNPEHNPFLKWDILLPIYEQPEKGPNTNPMILHYVLTELKRLKIDPVIQVGSTDFDSSWSNKWKQWQRYYALAFYAARTGDVTMYAMQNEPNHKNSGPMKLDQWIGGMEIVSDALTCAIEDVNRIYGKNLKARMVGPVTAGNNREWWAAVARSMRTDYHGKTIDHDLLGIFSTHSYNSPAAGYLHRVEDIRKILSDNQPGGQALPIVYTEIGRWMNAYLIDKEETMDDPSLFTEWAGIYANNTLNGAYGMWAFKFSNTTSSVYPLGIKSGHHFTWQGRRIVEDAYTDLAKGRPVKASSQSPEWPAKKVTDGDKSDHSAWHSDSTSFATPSSGSSSASSGSAPPTPPAKWLEIDLGSEKTLGSAVVYTGSAHDAYTSPDRVKDFSLQYFSAGDWKDIPGFTLKGNKYAQVFAIFKEPVTTSRVRFYSTDPGLIKVREIKVFAKDDGPQNGPPDYDISGIQRTGEVVHLFAKGFKDQHPLYSTTPSVQDANLDALTSFDKVSGNYYLWLVQRGAYKDKINLDLSSLPVRSGTPVTVECVGPEAYGEVTALQSVGANKKVNITLRPQSVMLLTIPSGNLTKKTISAAGDATVSGGKDAGVNEGKAKELKVALDASKPENNKVSFVRFDLNGKNIDRAARILLKLYGSNTSDTAIFRVHVYEMPATSWSQGQLSWKTAPQLDAKEALITEVGQKAFVAGELAMDHQKRVHYLDVTDLVRRHGGPSITFALVRETRQLGDDVDKGRTVVIASSETDHGPELEYWVGKNSNYYINSRYGNDTHTGKTKEDAWQSCKPLEQMTFQPGDSILFAKGSSYTGGFVFKSSGTADRPIVFSSYSAGADLVRTTPREQLADVFLKYGAGPLPAFTNPDWNTLNGNIFRIEGNHIVIDGLYFHDNTNPPGSDHQNKNVQKMGAIYLALGTHHNIVRNCEFFHSPVAIKIKGTYNLITKNYLHDATDTLAHSWGPIAIMVVKPHNEISYNRILNYGSYGGPYGSDGGVVEFDGVDDDFEGRDLNIHHNVSINNHGFLELAGRNVDSVTVAYNVSDDTNQFIGGGSMKNILVDHNTIVRLREPNVDRYVFWTFHPDSCFMRIQHNIFVLPEDIRVYGPQVKAKGHVRSFIGDQPHNHNLYFSAGDPDPLGIVRGKGDIVADPLFRDYANGDFHLRDNSPVKYKGIGAY